MGFAESRYDGWLDKYFVDKADRGTIIELGCGWGDDTSFLSKTECRLISCDYSEEALRNVKERYPAVTVNRFDLRDSFPFENTMADIVVASLCLHFFADSDMRRILAEVRRVIKPDGLFLCRLNSENGRMRGIVGETKLAPGLYMTKDGLKRFYTEDMIKNVFVGWEINCIREYETEKFSKNKYLFELEMKP